MRAAVAAGRAGAPGPAGQRVAGLVSRIAVGTVALRQGGLAGRERRSALGKWFAALREWFAALREWFAALREWFAALGKGLAALRQRLAPGRQRRPSLGQLLVVLGQRLTPLLRGLTRRQRLRVLAQVGHAVVS
jgi:hypothetical protein